MLNILSQILVAENETTTNVIASAMLLLLQHPEQMLALQADHALIPNCIEEALRIESPVQGLFHTAKVDTELSGVKIPVGARPVPMYGSGNRENEQFPHGGQFDIRRANAEENLAFGEGIHYCLEAPLTRLESKLAFETLFTRLQNIRLSPDKHDLTHTPRFILRGLKALHLEFEPA